jgi:2-polyprenyl-6-methoxyphenol hydroxylase-like FAD-dependent oxidoreductase
MLFHVNIIGGGIGGLCLAQGLRRAGISVAVYEKGPKRADPHWFQGYQIHINPSGSKALQECLPPTVWNSLAASACLPDSGFQVLTEQMEEITFVEPEIMDGTSHIRIVRTTLREVLLDGLDDVVNFEKEFVRYEQTPNGKVTAFFADERAPSETCSLVLMALAQMSGNSTCLSPESSIQGSLVPPADCQSAATAVGDCLSIS